MIYLGATYTILKTAGRPLHGAEVGI